VVVTRYPDASSFLAATHSFRAADPVFTNVIGSIAESVNAGRRYASERWLSVGDDTVAIAGIAMRTAPWNLSVSAMPETAAVELGRHLAAEDPDLPGISGPAAVVEAVLLGLASPRRSRLDMVDVALVLCTYRPPVRPPGSARLASRADLALLVSWEVQFADEAGLLTDDVEARVTDRVDAGARWLWERDGVPLAMAGHATPVDTPSGAVGRIGPVYTVPGARDRGYGSAVTAVVTEQLQTHCSVIMLFADAANPGSNRIYERLGFEVVGEIVEVRLED
jgi:predicted GNAT family acetyltransferase